MPTSREIKGYVADFRALFQEGTFPERKALVRNFVQGIEVVDDEAVLTYTIPMPQDGVTSESASVLDFVQSGPPWWTRTHSRPGEAGKIDIAALWSRFKLPVWLKQEGRFSPRHQRAMFWGSHFLVPELQNSPHSSISGLRTSSRSVCWM